MGSARQGKPTFTFTSLNLKWDLLESQPEASTQKWRVKRRPSSHGRNQLLHSPFIYAEIEKGGAERLLL